MFGNIISGNNSTGDSLQRAQIQHYLDELQRNSTIIMIPSMVYLCLLSVTGMIGNSLVLYVYSCKFTRSPIRTFILAAAVFDLLTNTVVIPADIYDMLHQWNFDWPLVCKARRYFNAITTLASAFLLVAISVTRYRKICRPFGRQVNVREAKLICAAALLVSLMCCLPYAIMNGRQKRPSHIPGVTGYFCSIDDNYITTKWPLVNSIFFLFLYLVCSTPLAVLYALIGSKAWRQRSFRRATLRLIIPREKGATKMTNDSSTSDDHQHILLHTDFKTTTVEKDTTNVTGSDAITAIAKTQPDGQTVLVCESATLSRIRSLHSDIADKRERSSVMLLRESCKRRGDSQRRVMTVFKNSFLRHEQEVTLSTTEQVKLTKSVTLSEECNNSDEAAQKNSEVLNTEDGSTDACTYEICGVVSSSELSTDESVAVSSDDPTPHRSSTLKDSVSLNTTASTSLCDSFLLRPPKELNPNNNQTGRTSGKATEIEIRNKRSGSGKRLRRTGRRIDPTSCMLLLISFVFVLCFLPFVGLQLYKTIAPEAYRSMGQVSTSMFNLFWRSYLLNSAANPIIYLLCDIRFRRACRHIVRGWSNRNSHFNL